MKNPRLKFSLLLISCLMAITTVAWYENVKMNDLMLTKNFSVRRVSFDQVLKIEDANSRQIEGDKFLNKLEEREIKDQDKIFKIFLLQSISVIFSLLLLILFAIALKKKKQSAC